MSPVTEDWKLGSENIQIRPCRHPNRFLKAQRAFYAGDPYYVPPLTLVDRWRLTPRFSPYLRRNEAEFSLATRNGQIVGRISVTRNCAHDEHHGDRIGFFGHFEAQDDVTARRLLDYAAAWCRARGATALRGPVDLSTNYKCGLLVEGRKGPPMVFMPYNPPEYSQYFTSYGLRVAKNLLAFNIPVQMLVRNNYPNRIEKLRARTAIQVRPIQFRHFGQEIRLLAGLYNRIWAANWGFSPMSLQEFRDEIGALPLVCPPALLQIAMRGDEPIGMILALPDFNPAIRACNGRLLHPAIFKFFRELRRTRRFRLMLLGVVPEHRKRGAEALLIARVLDESLKRGFEECEAGWILEDNIEMVRILENLGATVSRRYSVYEMSLRFE